MRCDGGNLASPEPDAAPSSDLRSSSKRSSACALVNGTKKLKSGDASHGSPSGSTLPPWPSRRPTPAASDGPSTSRAAEPLDGAGSSAAERSVGTPSTSGRDPQTGPGSSGAARVPSRSASLESAARPECRISPLVAYTVLGESCAHTRRVLAADDSLLADCEAWVACPQRMREKRFSTAVRGGGGQNALFDKAFSATWVDAEHVAVTTKCGRVLRVNSRLGTVEVIDVQRRRPPPSAEAARSPAELEQAAAGADARSDGSAWSGDSAWSGESGDEIHESDSDMEFRLLLERTPLLADQPPTWLEESYRLPAPVWQNRSAQGGIHSSALNPGASLLVVSGHDSGDNSAYVLDLRHPQWRAIHRAASHKDWVFGVTWISETAFATAGRDKLIVLWDVNSTSDQQPPDDPSFDLAPVMTYRSVHGAKVRCICHDASTDRMASCDAGGTVALWDAVGGGDMRVLRFVELDAEHVELACMHLGPDLVVVGFNPGLALFDPRACARGRIVASVSTLGLANSEGSVVYDPADDAVRSVACKGWLLSAGITSRVAFWDRRMLGRGVLTHVEAPGTAAAAAEPPAARVPRWLVAASPVAEALCNGGRSGQCGGQPVPSTKPAAITAALEQVFGGTVEVVNRVSRTLIWDPVSHVTVPSCNIERDAAALTARWAAKSTVFAHAWAPDGGSMMVCGGPLQIGLSGCYLGLWAC